MVSKNDDKKMMGQYYTVNASYILQDLPIDNNTDMIIEPFAGNGDLIEWLCGRSPFITRENILQYDVDPKKTDIIRRDTLLNPPRYKNSWVITNPPYLARNKSKDKSLYNKYNTNDLYKCFIKSLIEGECLGGIIIIPCGFFISPRPIDVECRNEFLTRYIISRVNYFEEDVFPDTSTTVVAFSFKKANEKMNTQQIEWVRYPKKEVKIFNVEQRYNWIIGGDIYQLPISNRVQIQRLVENTESHEEDNMITNLILTALDSGKMDGRISLKFKKNELYIGKKCSRSYATICITGINSLDDKQQELVATLFNEFIEQKRLETWSLFLPQFRESKEYARKRIPFRLAYHIIQYLIEKHL